MNKNQPRKNYHYENYKIYNNKRNGIEYHRLKVHLECDISDNNKLNYG